MPISRSISATSFRVPVKCTVAMPSSRAAGRLAAVEEGLRQAGAHVVTPSLVDVPVLLHALRDLTAVERVLIAVKETSQGDHHIQGDQGDRRCVRDGRRARQTRWTGTGSAV